jgi:hypothetical protein
MIVKGATRSDDVLAGMVSYGVISCNEYPCCVYARQRIQELDCAKSL